MRLHDELKDIDSQWRRTRVHPPPHPRATHGFSRSTKQRVLVPERELSIIAFLVNEPVILRRDLPRHAICTVLETVDHLAWLLLLAPRSFHF
jgi:hypothetical protein